MSSRYLTDLTEDERAFLQQRVALFGKVLLVISILAVVVQVLTSLGALANLWNPFFAWLSASLLPSGGLWLLCRRGHLSGRLVRAAEATAVILYTVTIMVMSRYLLLLIIPQYLEQPVALTAPPSALITLAAVAGQMHMGAVLALALTQALVVRAALVPTPPLYSAALTAVVGIWLITITALGIPGLSPEPLIERHTPADFPLFSSLQFSIWWGFTILVCAVISRVVFGLRREVHEARRLGQYTLDEKLGEGGMGMVYRAHHEMLRRPTAVKLLLPEKAGAQNVERFSREVRLTALLSHPNTVTIFDYGRAPDDVFYYAMELLDGASLDRVVAVGGPLPPARVCQILCQVAGALHEAHGLGLIHRDIKPANIMLCTCGGVPDVAKVLDFGLVKDMKDEQSVSLTGTNLITGTPQYMSPEAIARPAELDARTDIYSLGAVAYYLLTGQHVFEGNTVVEICSHHLHTPSIPPSTRLGEALPAELESLVLACLAKEPDDRPQTAAELQERLRCCDIPGEWNAEQARAWWREHGAACREADEPARPEGETRSTIAIDLGART